MSPQVHDFWKHHNTKNTIIKNDVNGIYLENKPDRDPQLYLKELS
jgi:hypothetical protein